LAGSLPSLPAVEDDESSGRMFMAEPRSDSTFAAEHLAGPPVRRAQAILRGDHSEEADVVAGLPSSGSRTWLQLGLFGLLSLAVAGAVAWRNGLLPLPWSARTDPTATEPAPHTPAPPASAAPPVTAARTASETLAESEVDAAPAPAADVVAAGTADGGAALVPSASASTASPHRPRRQKRNPRGDSFGGAGVSEDY
jgi:hypothetical protein